MRRMALFGIQFKGKIGDSGMRERGSKRDKRYKCNMVVCEANMSSVSGLGLTRNMNNIKRIPDRRRQSLQYNYTMFIIRKLLLFMTQHNCSLHAMFFIFFHLLISLHLFSRLCLLSFSFPTVPPPPPPPQYKQLIETYQYPRGQRALGMQWQGEVFVLIAVCHSALDEPATIHSSNRPCCQWVMCRKGLPGSRPLH